MKPINLIVQYYRCSNLERQAEIDACLKANLLNSHLTTIHLLTEEMYDLGSFPNNEKIIQTVIGERLTFEQAFRYANERDPEGLNVWVLSNADIYFDDSLQYLEEVNFTGLAFALTRHDVQEDGSIRLVDAAFAHGCQDVWVFNTPVPLTRMVTGFRLGIPGCDNRIAHEFITAGYKLINPSLKIISYHLDLINGVTIFDKDKTYAELMTDEGISQGRAAPPPYQYHIYPVDQLDPDSLAMYQCYIRDFNECGIRIAEKDKQISELGRLLDDAYKQLAWQTSVSQDLDRQLGEQEMRFEQIFNDMKNSISWKLTSPLRRICSLIKRDEQ